MNMRENIVYYAPDPPDTLSTPSVGRTSEGQISRFKPGPVAKDIINVLAKHGVALNMVDIIFRTAKGGMDTQRIRHTDIEPPTVWKEL